MMKVVGEEGTSIEDFIIYLKGEFLDAVYFQQNSFDDVDQAASPERQKYVYGLIIAVLGSKFSFKAKDEARHWFNQLRQKFIDYNYSEMNSDRFNSIEAELRGMLKEKSSGLEAAAEKLLA